jgi:cation transport protein ChaC
VATATAPVRAVTFVVNRQGPRYIASLDLERVAHHVATASGGLGSCIEYLHRTLESLDTLGLTDRMLREVHRLCAARAVANQAC